MAEGTQDMSTNGKPNGVDHSPVENNTETTEKQLGGVTGKGWMPGQSGNPGGRPKKKPFTVAIAERVDANPQEIADAVEHLMKLAKGEVAFCNGGPAVSAFKLMREAVEGKDVQPLSGPDGGPIEYRDMSDADLDDRIRQLLNKTGTSLPS